MKIGSLKLKGTPLFLAPMEDVTYKSFRWMCKKYGADVMYTEFVSSEALVRDVKKSKQKMELFDFEIDGRDLSKVREIITGKKGYIVDPLGHRMGNPPEAWYYLSDGMNPTLSGHVNTVKEVLRSLATAKVQE